MDRTSNNKEILKRYKCLIKSNYKERTNGTFDDCTKEILADLKAKSARQIKTEI